MSWQPPAGLDTTSPVELGPDERVFSIVVERWANKEPDRECLVQDDGATLTYGQLDQRAGAIAHGLGSLGVTRGDRVATLVGNDLHAVGLAVALAKLGAIEVPVNPALTGDSLRHVLGDADPKVAIVAPHHREALVRAIPDGRSPLVVTAAPHGIPDSSTAGPTLEEMLADNNQLIVPTATDVLPHSPSAIMYTSGTTGLPKGALLPHEHCLRIAERTAAALVLTGDDTLISILPLFHAGGRFMNIAACLLSGARCGMVRRFSGSAFFEQARSFRATVMHAVVSVGHFLLAQPPSAADREHTISRGLLAPCPPSLGAAFAERFGISVFEGYGSTESNLVAFNLGGTPGACGRAYPPYRLRIVDEQDRELPSDHTGEIVITCDEPWSTFSGYWNQPAASLLAVRNFGLHTGDAGYLDRSGQLWYVERLKDMIRRRGENVASQTVEDAINRIEPVAESAAYPLPSPFGEDEIAVAITLKPGARLSAEDVIAECRARLPRFAVPRYVRFVEQLPKTATGKTQKFVLKKEGTDGAHDFPEQRR